MSKVTVTAKGQLILDKELLKHLGVQPGEKILVEKLPEGQIDLKAARPTGRFRMCSIYLKTEIAGPCRSSKSTKLRDGAGPAGDSARRVHVPAFLVMYSGASHGAHSLARRRIERG